MHEELGDQVEAIEEMRGGLRSSQTGLSRSRAQVGAVRAQLGTRAPLPLDVCWPLSAERPGGGG